MSSILAHRPTTRLPRRPRPADRTRHSAGLQGTGRPQVAGRAGVGSSDRNQADLGAGLAFGGVVVIALLALLVWHGLF